jgi:putative component of membrane protein insertase Oxa1/YidC/SpoIIIJ protein YidD
MGSLQWEEYLKVFAEQKRLEAYQQNRVLTKPKTTKITVSIHLVALLMIIVVCSIGFFVFSTLAIWVNVMLLMACIAFAIETYGRFVAIKVVECYQHYAREEVRRRCKCIPSCSEYAILCLKKHELIYALIRIRKRLFVTCKGFAYIVDKP